MWVGTYRCVSFWPRLVRETAIAAAVVSQFLIGELRIR